MNEAAFKFKTFSATHPRKDEKTIWFLSALPMETDRDWSKTHLQIRGKRCCQGPHNSPSGRLLYMRMTWTVSRSSNDLALSLCPFVCLFTQLIHKLLSLWFSCSMWPWECRWSENGLSEWSLSCCAHGSHCTWDGLKMGLFEISKLHDYWSLPGACWLEMLFELAVKVPKHDGYDRCHT